MQLSILTKIVTGLALSTILSTAFATEKVLCIVTNDIDKEVGKMVVDYDEESRVVTHLYSEKWVNGARVERNEINSEDLVGEGVVLNRKDKHITVRLYSHNFDKSSGGVLYLDTLYNGVKGQRKEYVIEARMDGSEAVMTHNNEPFNRMHFVAKRAAILGVIGIEKVNFMK